MLNKTRVFVPTKNSNLTIARFEGGSMNYNKYSYHESVEEKSGFFLSTDELKEVIRKSFDAAGYVVNMGSKGVVSKFTDADEYINSLNIE